MRTYLLALAFTVALGTLIGSQTFGQIPANSRDGAFPSPQQLTHFESVLETLRTELKIPAISAAILKDQRIIWAKGFGYADIEKKIAATEYTLYHLASLTKTFASTILMQLVQEGKLSLDDPVSKYGITLESNGIIRVRHLLSHTSEGNPGEVYRYNGNRFGELDKVIATVTGKTFADLLIDRILVPLQMEDTAPNVPPERKLSSPFATKNNSQVESALLQLVDAFNKGDVTKLTGFFSPENTGFQGDGGTLTTFLDKQSLMNTFASGTKFALNVQEIQASVFGSTVLTTCYVSGSVNGQPEGPWRLTLLWLQDRGRWKIVHGHQSRLTVPLVSQEQRDRFKRISAKMARPYQLDKEFRIEEGDYPEHFSSSAGLISSVVDLAKYDSAIDHNRFLTPEIQTLAFTPTVSTAGRSLPYGLGWFVQDYDETKLIWHYGFWRCNSSLILKVPTYGMTFIILANTDNLSRPTDLGEGNVLSSPAALAFLHTFILPIKLKDGAPRVDWDSDTENVKAQLQNISNKASLNLLKKELVSKAMMASSVGKTDEAARLFSRYAEIYSLPLPDYLTHKKPIAQTKEVKDLEDRTIEFNINHKVDLRIFAVGEGFGGTMYDYGWIENAETGTTMWEMKLEATTHAGGAGKNRRVESIITLPPGKYRIRYKSDDSHSFGRWNSTPPDVNFWGIAVVAN